MRARGRTMDETRSGRCQLAASRVVQGDRVCRPALLGSWLTYDGVGWGGLGLGLVRGVSEVVGG